MSEATSVLFGLEDEFSVVQVDRVGDRQVRVVVETVSREGPCPGCGVVTSRVKDRPLVRIKDLPASGQRVELWWRKRRLACHEALCVVGSFTQVSEVIAPRARPTTRLRTRWRPRSRR